MTSLHSFLLHPSPSQHPEQRTRSEWSALLPAVVVWVFLYSFNNISHTWNIPYSDRRTVYMILSRISLNMDKGLFLSLCSLFQNSLICFMVTATIRLQTQKNCLCLNSTWIVFQVMFNTLVIIWPRWRNATSFRLTFKECFLL